MNDFLEVLLFSLGFLFFCWAFIVASVIVFVFAEKLINYFLDEKN